MYETKEMNLAEGIYPPVECPKPDQQLNNFKQSIRKIMACSQRLKLLSGKTYIKEVQKVEIAERLIAGGVDEDVAPTHIDDAIVRLLYNNKYDRALRNQLYETIRSTLIAEPTIKHSELKLKAEKQLREVYSKPDTVKGLATRIEIALRDSGFKTGSDTHLKLGGYIKTLTSDRKNFFYAAPTERYYEAALGRALLHKLACPKTRLFIVAPGGMDKKYQSAFKQYGVNSASITSDGKLFFYGDTPLK